MYQLFTNRRCWKPNRAKKLNCGLMDDIILESLSQRQETPQSKNIQFYDAFTRTSCERNWGMRFTHARAGGDRAQAHCIVLGSFHRSFFHLEDRSSICIRYMPAGGHPSSHRYCGI